MWTYLNLIIVFYYQFVSCPSYIKTQLLKYDSTNLSKYFSRLPKTNPLTLQIFSSFTLYNFSDFIHFIPDGSKNERGVTFSIIRLSLYRALNCLPHFLTVLHAKLSLAVFFWTSYHILSPLVNFSSYPIH